MTVSPPKEACPPPPSPPPHSSSSTGDLNALDSPPLPQVSAFRALHRHEDDACTPPFSTLSSGFLASFSSVQFSCSVMVTLCDPMNYSTPGLPVHHQLLEFTQTHAHRVGDAIQPSHPLSSPSPPASNPSQHQGLFQWVNSSHEVAKILEFQLQHQSFQWTLRTDLL